MDSHSSRGQTRQVGPEVFLPTQVLCADAATRDQWLGSDKQLLQLFCRAPNVIRIGGRQLGSALSLESLNWRGKDSPKPELSMVHADALTALLTGNQVLKELRLNHSTLSIDGAAVLAPALAGDRSCSDRISIPPAPTWLHILFWHQF